MKRKRVTMAVTVSVPRWMTTAQARREVRTLINHQSNWLYGIEIEGTYHEVHEKTVHCRKVGPATHA